MRLIKLLLAALFVSLVCMGCGFDVNPDLSSKSQGIGAVGKDEPKEDDDDDDDDDKKEKTCEDCSEDYKECLRKAGYLYNTDDPLVEDKSSPVRNPKVGTAMAKCTRENLACIKQHCP